MTGVECIWYRTNHTIFFYRLTMIILEPYMIQSVVKPGTKNSYGPEYDQPVFAWEGNPVNQ